MPTSDEKNLQNVWANFTPVLKLTEPQYECNRCGCLIPHSNVEKHSAWHETIKGVAGMLQKDNEK